MIVPFTDSVTGTAVYLNPAFVVSMRPDPDDPHRITILKLNDGEVLKVYGDHEEVASKFSSVAHAV